MTKALNIHRTTNNRTPEENRALNFWRDEFLKRGGKWNVREVNKFLVHDPALNTAFSELTDPTQYGGAYIVKKGNMYEWPGQIDRSA